jgi:hypothetical protein
VVVQDADYEWSVRFWLFCDIFDALFYPVVAGLVLYARSLMPKCAPSALRPAPCALRPAPSHSTAVMRAELSGCTRRTESWEDDAPARPQRSSISTFDSGGNLPAGCLTSSLPTRRQSCLSRRPAVYAACAAT